MADINNTETPIEDLTVMEKSKTYLIRFNETSENQRQAIITLTPITEPIS
ncbi:MAG: hypothetical protein J6Q15_00445 [Clostridia bacterium]|nr:hypothetical protein [Clostridia bacterium]